MEAGRRTVFLAGDALVVRPWSQDEDPAFLRLVETVRAADVAIANLETVIHEFSGYAQADSGGIHMHSPPEVAAELAWAGFDLVSHANNHTFDYGSSAVLETIAHATRAGLAIAGSGKDLQQARSPQYFDAGGFVVGLVAMAATFIPYGRASRSRADLHGRPGVNPLALSRLERGLVVPAQWKLARRIAERLGVKVRDGTRPRLFHGRVLEDADRRANLEAIAEAARHADLVVASIHAHMQGAWLERFADEALEHGAGAVFVHGPHEVGAIELRGGKPILYSLGDFAYETEYVAKHPSEAYEARGLDDDAAPEAIRATPYPTRPLEQLRREFFEGFVATLDVASGAVERIRIDPIDLRFDDRLGGRGRPRIADPELGQRIVATVAEKSARRGTTITYDPSENCGVVDCTQSSGSFARGALK